MFIFDYGFIKNKAYQKIRKKTYSLTYFKNSPDFSEKKKETDEESSNGESFLCSQNNLILVSKISNQALPSSQIFFLNYDTEESSS